MSGTRGLPDTVEADGVAWAIERAWPAKAQGGSIPLEARCGPEVRGGYARPDGRIVLLAPQDDLALPALGALAENGEVVSHRPGKRAVVRLADGYAKAVKRGRAGALARAHERGAAVFSAGFRVPELREDGQGDAVMLSAVGGRTLHELGEDTALPEAAWLSAWAAWRTAWVTSIADGDVDELPAHDAADEVGVLREWVGRAAGYAEPELGEAMRATAERIAGRLADIAAEPDSPAHRDLHDKQVLWDAASGSGIIDLDTCARADAGLDLGNLAAHVELALLQGRWPRRRARIAYREIERAAAELGVTQECLAAWRQASRFRVACVHLLRPPGRLAARRELIRLTLEEGSDG